MGHMAAGLNLDTSLIEMEQSEMVDFQIHMTGGVTIVRSILVMVQRDNIVIAFTICIGGVRSSTCQRNSRK